MRQREVHLDQLAVTFVVERAPYRDGLGPETAVREADDAGRAGLEHTRDLGEYLDWVSKILHRNRDQAGIEAPVVERQMRIAIEVVHDAPGEAGIGVEFDRVHPEPGDG